MEPKETREHDIAFAKKAKNKCSSIIVDKAGMSSVLPLFIHTFGFRNAPS